jgi:hypothetical protein
MLRNYLAPGQIFVIWERYYKGFITSVFVQNYPFIVSTLVCSVIMAYLFDKADDMLINVWFYV